MAGGQTLKLQKVIGGQGLDIITSIKIDKDKNYIIGGDAYSKDGDFEMYARGTILLKLDTNLNILWKYQLKDGGGESVRDLILTRDGDIVSIGDNASVTKHISVRKLDSNGNFIWQKRYGASYSDYGRANSIVEDDDGNYVISTITDGNNGDIRGNHGQSDNWIFKINSQGEIIWQLCVGGKFSETNSFLVKSPRKDGFYTISGSNSNRDTPEYKYDLLLSKVSNDGHLVWSKYFIIDNLNEFPSSMIVTDENDLLICASQSTGVNWSEEDVLIVRVSLSGDLIWKRTYGGSGGESSKAIAKLPGGDFIVTAETFSNDKDVSGNHGSADIWVFRINNIGTIQYQKCFGGSKWDTPSDVVINNNEEIIVVGDTQSPDGDLEGLLVDKKEYSNDGWVFNFTQPSQCLGSRTYTIGSGDGQSPDVWSCRKIPNILSDVIINKGHTIMLNHTIKSRNFLIEGNMEYVPKNK